MTTVVVLRDNITAFTICDNTFGPSAYHCSKDFDFTLLFEQSILTIAPSVVFLLAVPLRLAQLATQSNKVQPHPLHLLKLAACVLYGALQLTLLILWTQTSPATDVSVAAASLGIATAFAVGLLSYTEHNRSVRPSTIICLYLVFSLLLDIAQCRTLWLRGDTLLAAVYSATLASKTMVLALEVQGKHHFLKPAWQHLGPEALSGTIGRGFFWWLNKLMIQGFQATLSMATLYDTDDHLRSQNLLQRLQISWFKRRHTGKHALVLSVFDTINGAVLRGVIPRLCLIGFKFAQPFLINRIIDYVGEDDDENHRAVGYGLIAATALVYLGSALSTAIYKQKLFRAITMTRGALISLVCSHVVQMNVSSTEGSATLTLTSTDVDQICSSLESFHEIWATPIEIAISIWLLEMQLGVGCLGPGIIVIGMLQLSKHMRPSRKAWNQAVQQRVTTTSSIISSMKEVKMLGMTNTWLEAIQQLRVRELDLSKSFRTFIVYLNLLGNTPSMIGPVATFGIAVLASLSTSQPFSIATAFTSLSIISLLTGPLTVLISAVPKMVSSLGCFERIQAFLLQGSTVNVPVIPSPSQTPAPEAGFELLEQCRPHAAGNKSMVASVSGERTGSGVFVAQNAFFSMTPEGPPILKDISLCVSSSSMTIITGRVGSGKTTLLRGLLGEVCVTGSLQTSPIGVAYCSQSAWLINATIKQNILGQSPMEEKWYETVVHSCALDRDFRQLPRGDQSMIGSKGLSLSGGQRQRVALARAIYSRKPCLVIDDILSGLDWGTRDTLWKRVFSRRGLLRMNNATVILVTHFASLYDDADNVVVLGDDGYIAQQGASPTLRTSPLVEISSGPANQTTHPSSVEVEDSSSPQQARTSQGPDDHENTPSSTQHSGDASLYWYYLKSIGWRLGTFGLSLSATAAFCAVFPQIWLKFWADANDSTLKVDTGMYFGIYALVSLLGLGVIGLDIWFMFVMILPTSARNLHLTLLQTVMRAPLAFFVSTDTGDLVNRFSQDMSLFDMELPSSIFTSVAGVFSCIADAILILIGAKYLAAVLPVALLVLYGLQNFYLRTSRQMRLLDLQAKSPLYTHLLQTVDGHSTIRAFGWGPAFCDSALELLDASQRPYYLLFCIQRWLELALDLFVAASAVLLVTLGILTPGGTSASAMAVALYNILGFNQSLANLMTSWTELETSLGAISRLKTFEKETPSEAPPIRSETVPPLWPTRGLLELRDVTASYSSNTEAVVKNVSLVVQPGEKVAVCGRTGSGKSSLLLTIFRLIDLDSGSITLDGVDISQLPQNVLRPRLIAVPQEPMIFPGTLRSNLIPALMDGSEPPSNHRLITALTTVGLWDAICLHGGLDTDISDLSLSEGQKQLVCLARAVLRKSSSKVLLLDEAMSAVDQQTEDLMVRVLETEFAEHTVISVVHRLNTIANFDRVIVLEQGQVVEVGAPHELLQKDGGQFKTMWDRKR